MATALALPPTTEQRRRITLRFHSKIAAQQHFWASTKPFVLYLGGIRAGKLLRLSTPIPTPKGWTPIGDLHLGDEVFDEMGQVCRVVAAHPAQTPERAYRLTFSDGTTLVAGGDHQWVTWSWQERRALSRYGRARDTSKPLHTELPPNWPTWRAKDRYGKPWSGPQIRTTDDLFANQTHGKRQWTNHSIPLCGPLQAAEADLPIPPYTLGLWLGDGSKYAAVLTMSCADMKEVSGFLVAEGISVREMPSQRQGTASAYRLGAEPDRRDPRTGRLATNGSLTGRLDKVGLLRNKHVPEIYLRSSSAQRLALLQGLLDSDGHCEKKAGRIEFCNTNRSLAKAVTELARSLGQKPVMKCGRATLRGVDYGPKWRVTWRPTIPVFRLKRKLARMHPLGLRGIQRQRLIVSVESVPPEPMRCITVDSPNSLYLAGEGMIPTHNSYSGAAWVLTRPPGSSIIVAAPTYKVLDGGILPLILRWVEAPLGEGENAPILKLSYNQQKGVLRLIDGKMIYLRSMEREQNTKGITASHVLYDEAGLDPDRAAWDVLIGRLSSEPGHARATTTPPPEGKRSWLYDTFVTNADPDLHDVFSSRTADNPYIRADFESTLRREYAEAYALRELDAQWIDVGAVEVYEPDKILTRLTPPPDLVRTARAWDMAGTGGAGDYTAGVLLSLAKDGQIYWRDVVRGQWEPRERDDRILRTAQNDGVGVQIWVPQERGGAGKSQAEAWKRLLVGFSVKATLETGDKVTRAGPLAAQVNAGNVTFTSEPGMWENYFQAGKHLSAEAARSQCRANLAMFPAIRTKDESDAATQALQMVVRRDSGITIGTFSG